MSVIDYPQELSKAHWDKKKGSVPAGSDLETRLKTLQKKHEAVDWKPFDPSWVKGAKSVADVEAAYAERDRVWRAKVAPLKLEANGVADAAQKAAKDKAAGKPLLEAAKAIADAVKAYAKAIDAGAAALEQLAGQAQKILAKRASQEEESGEGEDEDGGSQLLDPKRLLAQLQQCRRDPARRVDFAFIDGDGKDAPPQFVLSPKTAGRTLFAKVQKETGRKTGAYGLAGVEGTTLLLQVEKAYGGLVKKVRVPVKACGFTITKVLLVDLEGKTLEQDEEEAETEAGGKAPPKKDAARDDVALRQALDGWKQAREAAVTTLKDVAKEIAVLRDAEANKAIIELNAVIKNLTPEPASARQVAELIRYVDKDDVVLDVSDFASDIRTPLLRALARLHQATA
ncbi:MAG: hypothetical protein EPO12_04330 [Aquabacterium sp.]|jgi:hypothetical protein|nr:MAG: hypothetical protein EPO12_04330 [Aquabacterium sp.]